MFQTTHFIELTQPRQIIIGHGLKKFTFIVPPISEACWFAYFDAIVSSAERKGNEIVQHVDSSSAGIELVDSVVAFGGDRAASQVSLAYRLAVANVLTSAYVPDNEVENHSIFEAVPLHAIWSANEKGAMRRHTDLVHLFEAPTSEQNRRYRRDDSRAQVIGGSRKGTTIYHGAQRTLAALYDELIVSVKGYAVNGEPLEGNRESIIRNMDTYHKVAAVVKLFTPAEVEIEVEQ